MSGPSAYDLYPNLDSWEWWWHQPVRGQKVKRYKDPESGDIIDLYNVAGTTFAVTPNPRKAKGAAR